MYSGQDEPNDARKALGVTFQQIQKSEKSVNLFGSGRLLKIADVIECNVTELFGGDSDAPTIISTPFSKFMATKNGVAIIEAMLKIKTPALRRTVIEVAEKLAKTEFMRSKSADGDAQT